MKKLIDLLVPEDAKKQCKKDPRCHRIDGHSDGCKTLSVALVEKAFERVRRWLHREEDKS